MTRRPTVHEIAAQAYALYLERGRKDGCALDDWLEAEQLLTEDREFAFTPLAGDFGEWDGTQDVFSGSLDA